MSEARGQRPPLSPPPSGATIPAFRAAPGQTDSLSDSGRQNLTLCINYRFVDEGARPGLIGFADVAALENTAARGTNFQAAKSGTIGFTTYRVLDELFCR